MMFARIVVWLFCIDQLAALKEFKRAFQAGDVMLGGLTVLHHKDSNDKCGVDIFPVGFGHAEAMIFTIEQINNDPSLLPNVTLGFDIRDYCETVSIAVKETYEFVRDADLYHRYTNRNLSMDNETTSCYSKDDVAPVSTIIGPDDSASSVQISNLLSIAKIPIISFAATSDELSSDQYPYFLRTVPPDRQQAKVQADLFEYFKWTYIGTVALDDSYGRFGVSALQKEAYNRGTFCLAFSEFIPRLRAATDIKQIVSRIKQQSNVKVIVVWVFGGYAKLFFKEVHRQKLGKRTWILGDGTSTEDSGLLGPYFRLLDGALGVQPRDRKDKTFLNYLYSITPNKTRLGRNPWWEEFWKKFRNCTPDADSAADPQCANVPLLPNEVSILFDPYLGYLIDAVFAVAFALEKQFSCRTLNRELSGEACADGKPLTTDGKDLLSHLKSVSFKGLTGVVEFDREGDPKNSFFEIVNVQINSNGDSKKALVGSWNSNKKPRLALNDSAIKWANATFTTKVPSSFCSQVCPPGTRQEVTTSCCWKCVTCPGGTVSKSPGSTDCTECPRKQKPNDDRTKCEDLPVKNLHFRDAAGVILSCATALGFCMTVAMLLVFVKYHETPIVKASNKQLSFLLLATIFSSFTLALLSITKPTDSICRLIQFSRYAIYTTFASILWLKSVRIFVLFKVDSPELPFQSYFSRVKYQVGLVALVNIVDIVLLTAWFASDPPYRKEKIQPTQFIFYTCKLYGSSVGKAFYFMVFSYVLLLSLLSSFYAFKVRKVPDNFNEARFIGFSLYIILLSALCYYSVDFSVQDAWYVSVIACSTTLVDSFGLLGCMFIPKAFIILFRPEKNKKELIGAQITAYVRKNTQLANVNTRDSRSEINHICQSSSSIDVGSKN